MTKDKKILMGVAIIFSFILGGLSRPETRTEIVEVQSECASSVQVESTSEPVVCEYKGVEVRKLLEIDNQLIIYAGEGFGYSSDALIACANSDLDGIEAAGQSMSVTNEKINKLGQARKALLETMDLTNE